MVMENQGIFITYLVSAYSVQLELATYCYLHIGENLSLSKVIPCFWMPKYCDATDASARTLKIYKDKMNDESLLKNEVVEM